MCINGDHRTTCGSQSSPIYHVGPRYQTQVVRLGSKCLTHWGILPTQVLVLSKYISFSYAKYISFSYALCSLSISHFSAKQKSDQCSYSDGSFWGGSLWGPLVSCGLSHSSSSGLRICNLPTPEPLTLSLSYQSHWGICPLLLCPCDHCFPPGEVVSLLLAEVTQHP